MTKPRLYIFAIGGTGSRVLKSLTMLLAAGIKPEGETEFEIIPIVIDPHKSNEDLKRTDELILNYQAITREIGFDNGFFSTELSTPDKILKTKTKALGSFTFNLQQVAKKEFKDYIDLANLNEPNKALANILFSGKSINKRGEQIDLLDIEMDIGFVGNPNIGSVVLNQFKDSDEFKEFASNFNEADRIFIISSIFGGTGAAGFPTILKNIRDAMNNKNIDGKGFLQNAKIGAITVLPYFNIEKETDSPIQKSDFIAKTKAALSYYKDNVTGNNLVNALYYIADNYTGKAYKNDPGDGGQKNDAHFIELASALAIINFLEISDDALQTDEGSATCPIYREFSIKRDSTEIKFEDLEIGSEKKISLKLSQLSLFKKFIDEHLKSSKEKQAWSMDAPAIDDKFLSQTFYKTYLSDFLNAYGFWLAEMDLNRRGFSPFALKTKEELEVYIDNKSEEIQPFNPKSLTTFIKDKEVKQGWFKKTVDYSFFDDCLSKEAKGKNYNTAQAKFVKLFFETTKHILTSKFGFQS